MLPITPLDYERYAVAYNPLQAQEAGLAENIRQPRVTEPAGAPATQLKRQNTQTGENQRLGDVSARQSRLLRTNGESSLSLSSSSVSERVNLTGIPPEVLVSETDTSKVSYQNTTEQYQPSPAPNPSKINTQA